MAANFELATFINEFMRLNSSGINSKLELQSYYGKVYVNINAELGFVSPPPTSVSPLASSAIPHVSDAERYERLGNMPMVSSMRSPSLQILLMNRQVTLLQTIKSRMMKMIWPKKLKLRMYVKIKFRMYVVSCRSLFCRVLYLSLSVKPSTLRPRILLRRMKEP